LLNLRLEIRYAVLISLLLLLWLSLEFMAGLHDMYIQYHPIVAIFALVVPVVCSRMAIKEKREQLDGTISFKQAFITGLLIAVFASILAIPSQMFFHTVINPNFFQNMIAYSEQRAAGLRMNIAEAKAGAEVYFNLSSYMLQCFLGTLFFGTIISVILAWRMRTVK
jgi:hypothetical protein